jgi:hypothetical protein
MLTGLSFSPLQNDDKTVSYWRLSLLLCFACLSICGRKDYRKAGDKTTVLWKCQDSILLTRYITLRRPTAEQYLVSFVVDRTNVARIVFDGFIEHRIIVIVEKEEVKYSEIVFD